MCHGAAKARPREPGQFASSALSEELKKGRLNWGAAAMRVMCPGVSLRPRARWCSLVQRYFKVPLPLALL